MHTLFYQFYFLVVSIAGWMNQHQQQVIEYLLEENRVLREQIGTRRMRFNDDQRRRLAARAKQPRPMMCKKIELLNSTGKPEWSPRVPGSSANRTLSEWELLYRLNPDSIVNRGPNSLFASEVALGSLN